MKGLIRNYIDLLTVDKLNEFGLKNDIHLNNDELIFLLEFIKKNWEGILIDENKYLNVLSENINKDELKKIKELFLYYKNRYKGYLF